MNFEALKQAADRCNEAGLIMEKYGMSEEDKIKLIGLLGDDNDKN